MTRYVEESNHHILLIIQASYHTVVLKMPRLGFIITVIRVRLLKFGGWTNTSIKTFSDKLEYPDRRASAVTRRPSGSGNDRSVFV
jgi:hypothetical protein